MAHSLAVAASFTIFVALTTLQARTNVVQGFSGMGAGLVRVVVVMARSFADGFKSATTLALRCATVNTSECPFSKTAMKTWFQPCLPV